MDMSEFMAYVRVTLPENQNEEIDAVDLQELFAVVFSLTRNANTSFDVIINAAGNSITDARLVGKIVSSISTNAASYNREYWEKPLDSNTLTAVDLSGLSFNVGQVVTIYTQ